jgi:hypothetical protein
VWLRPHAFDSSTGARQRTRHTRHTLASPFIEYDPTNLLEEYFMRVTEPRTYFLSMGVFWLVFGLITTFYPSLMDLFQTAEGVAAKTAFSNHVWFHNGLDIIALCVLLFALSTQAPSRTMLRAAAVAALGPTIAITWSLVATSWWNPLFVVAGLGCFGFSVWGFLLANPIVQPVTPVAARI